MHTPNCLRIESGGDRELKEVWVGEGGGEGAILYVSLHSQYKNDFALRWAVV